MKRNIRKEEELYDYQRELKKKMENLDEKYNNANSLLNSRLDVYADVLRYHGCNQETYSKLTRVFEDSYYQMQQEYQNKRYKLEEEIKENNIKIRRLSYE